MEGGDRSKSYNFSTIDLFGRYLLRLKDGKIMCNSTSIGLSVLFKKSGNISKEQKYFL